MASVKKPPDSAEHPLAAVIAKEMPGWRIVQHRDETQTAAHSEKEGTPVISVDSVSPSIRRMKAKYSGGVQTDEDAARDDEGSSGDRETSVVTVESDSDGAKRKLVGVRDKKIVWEQG